MQHGSGNRYRTVQYFKHLETRGIVADDPHWHLRTQWDLWKQGAEWADVIWIARRLLPPFKLAQLLTLNPNLVFDFDDALWLRSSRRGSGWALSKAFKFNNTLECSRAVMAGNEFLADAASRVTDPRKVHLVPTTVNRDWYAARPQPQHKEFVVGWIGSRSTLPYLLRLRPVFEGFHALGIPWRLKVVSDHFPDWSHLPLERKPWRRNEEEADLHDMDVGINPLTDDDWSRGKCALKAVQTLAAGVPVCASPVGVNTDLLIEGQTGFLCSTASEWVEALETLARNRSQAHAMGMKGREHVWPTFTMEAQAEAVATILTQAAK